MNDGGKIMSYLVSCLLVSSWHMSLVVVVAGGSGGSCWARGRCGRCRRRGNDRYSQVSVVPEERRSAEFGSHSVSSGAGDAGFFTNTEPCSLLLLRGTTCLSKKIVLKCTMFTVLRP